MSNENERLNMKSNVNQAFQGKLKIDMEDIEKNQTVLRAIMAKAKNYLDCLIRWQLTGLEVKLGVNNQKT